MKILLLCLHELAFTSHFDLVFAQFLFLSILFRPKDIHLFNFLLRCRHLQFTHYSLCFHIFSCFLKYLLIFYLFVLNLVLDEQLHLLLLVQFQETYFCFLRLSIRPVYRFLCVVQLAQLPLVLFIHLRNLMFQISHSLKGNLPVRVGGCCWTLLCYQQISWK